MKSKKFNKKLALNKSTMCNLNGDTLRDLRGGNRPRSEVEETVCCNSNGGTCTDFICCPGTGYTCEPCFYYTNPC